MKLLVLTAAMAIGAGSTTADAWEISTTPVTATTDARVNEPFAKTWTIAGNALEALTVQSMGRVFVDYDASLQGDNVAATVVITGDQRDLLDAIEVVEANDQGITVHFQNDAFEGHGYVLTQISVAKKHALRNVTMAWSADLVVGSNVLVEHDRRATVGLALVGSGDLYAGSPSTALSLGALGVTLTGAGNLQLLATSISIADTVDTTVAGSGDLAIVADHVTVNGTLSSLVAGSGDVFVQSERLTAQNLSSVVAGSGDITYSRAGACVNQNVVIVGSGDVATASIACVDTAVNLVGSGDVVVQTSGRLAVSTFFLGDVRYYGVAPATITAASLFDYGESHKHSKQTVRATATNDYDAYDVRDTPVRAPVYVVVKTSHDADASEPRLHYALELETCDAAVVQRFLAQQHSQLEMETEKHATGWRMLMVVVSGGLACVVAFGVIVVKLGRRRRAYRAL